MFEDSFYVKLVKILQDEEGSESSLSQETQELLKLWSLHWQLLERANETTETENETAA